MFHFANATTGVRGYGAAFGGAIHLDGSDMAGLVMGNHATFSNNYADGKGDARGGAIHIGAAVDWYPNNNMELGSKRAFLTLGDHASFVGNYVDGSSRGYSDSYSRSYGGAISMAGADNSHVSAALGANTVFSGNYATLTDGSQNYCQGGAIHMSGGEYSSLELRLGANAVFSGNRVSCMNVTGRLTNGNNYGGAIDMSAAFGSSNMLLILGENAIFCNNLVVSTQQNWNSDAMGGAISMRMYSEHASTLWIQDGAAFTNNYASERGGAIYIDNSLASIVGSDICSFLGAFSHNVVFRGNMSGGSITMNGDGSHTVENGIANAIHIQGRHILRLVAGQGRGIRFYDPITNENYIPGEKEMLILSLNLHTTPDGSTTNGTIIFSEELYQGDDAHLTASPYNDFKGQTVLYGGTLVLEHEVVFRNSELREDTSATFLSGVLEMTGSSVLNAAQFTLSSGNFVLRPGSAAFINATHADLSRGFVFDLSRQMQEGNDTASMTGLTVNASQSFKTSGTLGIMDTGATADYFYADNAWARQRTFTVLTDANGNHEGDFSGVYSLATGSDHIESPFTYTGMWSHEWVDTDGDGFAERLQVVWNPDAAPISNILPELAGSLAVNSMWSSVSNMQNVSSAALGNLDALRFTAGSETNYWLKGMGDFLYQASEDARDGFNYNGGGCSVGANRKITPRAILGLAFGELDGKMYSRNFVGDIRQQTRLGLLYGGWRKELNQKNTLQLNGSFGYGWTDNSMNSFHTGGWSHSEWTNRTLTATLKALWSRAWNERFSLNVTLGIEYADVTQEAFTETGCDARRFEKGRLKNMSLPVGTGFTHRSTLGGKTWVNSASVSYVPDHLPPQSIRARRASSQRLPEGSEGRGSRPKHRQGECGQHAGTQSPLEGLRRL